MIEGVGPDLADAVREDAVSVVVGEAAASVEVSTSGEVGDDRTITALLIHRNPAHRPSDFLKAERLSVAKTVLGLQVLCDSRQILMCYRGECKVVIGYEREFESVINIA